LHLQWGESFASLDDIDAVGNHTPQASGAEGLLTQAIRDARQAVLDVLKNTGVGATLYAPQRKNIIYFNIYNSNLVYIR